MAFKPAGNKFDETIDIKPKKDHVTEGVYLGVKKVEGFGNIHSIGIDGVNKSFWGTGALDYKLDCVPKFSKVRITYKGMEKDVPVKITSKTGKISTVKKDVHTFDVEYDDEGIATK